MIGKFVVAAALAYIAAVTITINMPAMELPPGRYAADTVAPGKLIACRLRFEDTRYPMASMIAVVESNGVKHEFEVARGSSIRIAGFAVDPELRVWRRTIEQYNGGVRHTYGLEGVACR